jgi:hypothetical protein
LNDQGLRGGFGWLAKLDFEKGKDLGIEHHLLNLSHLRVSDKQHVEFFSLEYLL